MNTPLITVICLCYNQKRWVGAAIRSVLSQSYKNIELIVVDDGSTDGSKEEIRELLKGCEAGFLDLNRTIGNCAAFNEGFRSSRGQYIIDLAADDLLLPARVEEGVRFFENASQTVGVQFSDAFLIDEEGQILTTHYKRDPEGMLIEEVPSGDVYLSLITTYFISPPTMMIRREVLDKLGGYDESLSYEDFDFWIRSSRKFDYTFHKAPLVKKRIVKGSHSSGQIAFFNKHAKTTYSVCEKIFSLNHSKAEDEALGRRCNYEIRQCLRTLNFAMIPKYVWLKTKIHRRLSSASNMER